MQDDRVKKSLKYSILDGAFFSAMVGFGESFFSAFAVFLKASTVQLGLLDALPKSLGSISQLFANRLTRLLGSRQRFVTISVLLEALMYIPIALVFFFGNLRVYMLILFFCVYWVLGLIVNPAWSSWMGDLVDPNERGRYFSRRNKIAGLVTFACFLAGGFVLQKFSSSVNSTYIGFIIIFTLALCMRIVSYVYLTKKYEPPQPLAAEAPFTFVVLRQATSRNYGLLALYLSSMNFAVYLAAPFFAAYMLYDLKLTYIQFTLVLASAIMVKYLTLPIWGRACDRFGTRKILSLTGFIMPLVPALWLFSTEFYYLIAIQVYSGFVWAGFELSSFNFIFDTTKPRKRQTCVAYYNAINGVAIFTGAILGSLVVKYNSVFWSKYLLIFLISGIFRLLASAFFVPRLREVRQVEHIPYSLLLFKVTTIAPAEGLIYEMNTFGKRLERLEKAVTGLHREVIGKNVSRVKHTIASLPGHILPNPPKSQDINTSSSRELDKR